MSATSLASESTIAVGGPGGEADYVNTEITGAAAKTLFETMSEVRQEYFGPICNPNMRPPMPNNITKRGDHMTCTKTIDVKVTYSCYFGMDKHGAISRDRLRNTLEHG